MCSSLKVSGVRDSVPRERKEAVGELVASEENIVMIKEVDWHTRCIDRLLRLDLRAQNILKYPT